MRNLKKILALALVFAMAFAFTASAASFTDQATIGADYVDDVNMLVELGVIAGYPDGSFGPQKNITRAEFTKMAYTLKYGSDTDGNLFASQPCAFTDVANDSWAKGYINYCYNQKIVSGKGANKFDPNGNITVAEAAKMILVIMGCDPNKEGFVGANWMPNVVAKAIDLGVFDGWAGDPTALATRELIAKLMRNAIFSPVYEYSAISGLGSQMDALGQDYNITLGEKTMGLFHVEGLVVANERLALATDDEGEEFVVDVDATGDEEESLIYYVEKDLNGNEYENVITINRGLDDAMLGCKVDVYFSADTTKSNGILNYNNIEVLGNVIVNSDTVVYETSAIAADVYPDGDSNSKTTILPYIGFTAADGSSVKINVDKKAEGIEKLAKSEDAQDDAAVIAAFNKYAYTYEAKINSEDAELVYGQAGFLNDMGYPTLAKYRFISVDGGKTFPYMIKTVVDATVNANYGTIANYSESKGTITLSGVGSMDIEDCVINGTVATDDAVVYYRENGKLVINKVEAISGAVESYTDKGGVVIGGNEYYAWLGCEDVDNGDLHEYYMDNKNAQQAGTTYYVYNNLIMEIDAEETAASVENYAVILRAYYDKDMDTAYVKLGFADNSEATYKVGKTYLKNSREPNSRDNLGNRPQDFELNSYFGAVVEYKIMANGSVDLSGQDFADEDFEASWSADLEDSELQVYDSKFTFKGKTSYALNDGTIIFALYGVPCYVEGGEVNATIDEENYAPVRSRAYKLNELRDMKSKAIKNLYIGNENRLGDLIVGSVVYNTNKGNAQYVVAGSMTVGDVLKNAEIAYNETNAIAYVVSATQRYNNANDSYFAEFTLINEDGLFTATTVENVQNTNTADALKDGVIGNISNKGEGDGLYPAGSFIRFEKNADGVLTTIDNDGLYKSDIVSTESLDRVIGAGTQQGLFLVNVTNERNGILSFFDVTNDAIDPANDATNSCKLSEDGYDIIGIDDDTYVGQTLTKVSTRASDEIPAFYGNAIVELEEGEIIRVFSFVDGYGY